MFLWKEEKADWSSNSQLLRITSDVIHCPQCQSEYISRNSMNGRGKQSYKCRDFRRKFVITPGWSALGDEQKELIDRLLLERLSLADITRVMQRSEDCIQHYVNRQVKQTYQSVEVTPKAKSLDRSDGRTLAHRGQQRKQAVGLACTRCSDS